MDCNKQKRLAKKQIKLAHSLKLIPSLEVDTGFNRSWFYKVASDKINPSLERSIKVNRLLSGKKYRKQIQAEGVDCD